MFRTLSSRTLSSKPILLSTSSSCIVSSSGASSALYSCTHSVQKETYPNFKERRKVSTPTQYRSATHTPAAADCHLLPIILSRATTRALVDGDPRVEYLSFRNTVLPIVVMANKRENLAGLVWRDINWVRRTINEADLTACSPLIVEYILCPDLVSIQQTPSSLLVSSATNPQWKKFVPRLWYLSSSTYLELFFVRERARYVNSVPEKQSAIALRWNDAAKND